MNHRRVVVGFVLLAAVAWSGLAAAKEVKLPYKGLTLNAQLDMADGKTLADGVVLITHGALAHNGMEAIAYLRNLLKEKGYSSLAINLSLGLNNRQGMYDCKLTHRHRNEDAADEIGVWIEWLKKQGAKRVALLGHSRGGAQTALFASARDDALVQAVVLLAPATRDNTSAAAYQQRYGAPLAPLVRKAQQLIKDGKGATVLDKIGLMTCRDTSATAEAFVSYYGPDTRVDTPDLIAKIKKPTLVVIAGNDEVVVGLNQRVAPLADGKRVHMKIIDGADHMFRDLYGDDAVEEIVGFLQAS